MTGRSKSASRIPTVLRRLACLVFVSLVVLPGVASMSGSTKHALAAPTTTPVGDRDDPRNGESSTSPASSVTLRLENQTSWVAPEDTFHLVLSLEGDPTPDTRLALRFYDKVSGRIRFSESIAGDGLGPPLQPVLAPVPLEEVPRDAEGHLVVDVPISATEIPESGIRLTAPGVYPVSIAVTDGAGREIDSFVTHLVRSPDGELSGPPLAVSVVVPFHTAPALQPDGNVTLADSETTRLESIAQSLVRNPGLATTIAPTPETLDAVATLASDGDDADRYAEILGKLRASSATSQSLAMPYVRIDIGSWIHSDMGDPLDQQLDHGARTVSEVLGAQPVNDTWIVDDSVTPQALDVLYSKGVRQLVIPSDLLSDPPQPWSDVTFTNTFDVTSARGTPIRSVGADTDLASRLVSTDDEVLNAHLALADLAVIYFDRPSRSRGVALLLPSNGTVPSATLDAFTDGLATSPLARATTTDGLFRVTDPAGIDGVASSDDTVLVRDYKSERPRSLDDLRHDLTETADALSGLRSMVVETPEVLVALDNSLLVAGTRGFDRAHSRAYLDHVTEELGALAAGVTAPPKQVVTLTSRSAKIPLAIDNHLEFPVEVSVRLVSEKLVFPDGDVIDVTLPAASTTRLEIAVEARASGAFPVEVNMTSPDGSLDLGSARLTLRSTAISGLGLALSIGAGLFLAVWWLRHFRSTRRARRLISSGHPCMTSTSPTPDEQASDDPVGDVATPDPRMSADRRTSAEDPVSYAPADHD